MAARAFDPLDCVGIVLAGGRARRMNGEPKTFLALGGESLIARVVARVRSQVGTLLIVANDDPAHYAGLTCEVIADQIGGFAGPLAGILTGLAWARTHRPGVRWCASFACDTPFLPIDLVARLAQAAAQAQAPVAVPQSLGQTHWVFTLVSTAIAADAEQVLAREHVHKVEDWIARFPNVAVPFDATLVDPFFNINTPDDFERARTLLAAHGGAR